MTNNAPNSRMPNFTDAMALPPGPELNRAIATLVGYSMRQEQRDPTSFYLHAPDNELLWKFERCPDIKDAWQNTVVFVALPHFSEDMNAILPLMHQVARVHEATLTCHGPGQWSLDPLTANHIRLKASQDTDPMALCHLWLQAAHIGLAPIPGSFAEQALKNREAFDRDF